MFQAIPRGPRRLHATSGDRTQNCEHRRCHPGSDRPARTQGFAEQRLTLKQSTAVTLTSIRGDALEELYSNISLDK